MPKATDMVNLSQKMRLSELQTQLLFLFLLCNYDIDILGAFRLATFGQMIFQVLFPLTIDYLFPIMMLAEIAFPLRRFQPLLLGMI